jgi:hypothetical protein
LRTATRDAQRLYVRLFIERQAKADFDDKAEREFKECHLSIADIKNKTSQMETSKEQGFA